MNICFVHLVKNIPHLIRAAAQPQVLLREPILSELTVLSHDKSTGHIFCDRRYNIELMKEKRVNVFTSYTGEIRQESMACDDNCADIEPRVVGTIVKGQWSYGLEGEKGQEVLSLTSYMYSCGRK